MDEAAIVTMKRCLRNMHLRVRAASCKSPWPNGSYGLFQCEDKMTSHQTDFLSSSLISVAIRLKSSI